ncbi:a50f5cd3-e9b6-49c2-ba82-a3636d0dbed6 [Thermothielavioides terrestris]|uniref:A50f5cd3-e9b6-49c2-ba82-a3636d0dbed6 n=1 Tax=Thermothielavioides terrestris TaxID=2587410 RepID=A0A3S4AZG9_9PEZI|nr:a50f5cd3-e9b6-49c2-ba82-a3636d0dbed6 [Thermothielavioides terrestris]
MAGRKRQRIADEAEVEIRKVGNEAQCGHMTPDDKALAGAAKKARRDITSDAHMAGLEPVADHEIYPEAPADTQLTRAPETLDMNSVYIKRPVIKNHSGGAGATEGAMREATAALLAETLALEKLSKTPHPCVVQYHGCHVRRGRIMAVVLERLSQTLNDYAYNEPGKSKFARLDKDKFLAGVDSAVKFLHSLRLAHNNVSPDNIVVREAGDGSCWPLLTGFGSCAPFGAQLVSIGKPGFTDPEEKSPVISHKKNDEIALARLREWWEDARQLGAA